MADAGETFNKVFEMAFDSKIAKAAWAVSSVKSFGIGNSALRFKVKGDLSKTYKFLNNAIKYTPENILRRYGEVGVQRLSEATPVDSGETAASWYYEVEHPDANTLALIFANSNVREGCNIAYILQMGHGTRQGTYVQGKDYINPALEPILNEIASGIYKEVANL